MPGKGGACGWYGPSLLGTGKGPEGKICWPTYPFLTWTPYMGTEHSVCGFVWGVLGCDHGWVPFPLPAPREKLATLPSPVLLGKFGMLNEHSPEV